MALFSIDIPIYATFYIRAEDEAAALKIAKEMAGDGIELRDDEHAEIPITGRDFDDPELADVSMSPAMTVGDVEAETVVEFCAEDPDADDADEDDTQEEEGPQAA